jgi:glutamate-1-semialdehyde 2,1-aminomutase
MRNSASLEATYIARTPKSAAFEARGLASLPITSSRGISFHPPYPVTIDYAQGPFLHDIDGNRYIDLGSNFFSMIHGYAYQPITDAVTAQLARGSVWSANNAPQVDLAEQIVARVPSIEKVLFNNSGTEAFNLALNICRGATGRYKFLMAEGGYHGSMYDPSLGSKGLPGPSHYVAPYGTDAFVAAIREHGPHLAGVFIEGVMGSGGYAQAEPGFFAKVKQACAEVGTIFVLDEVISLRLSEGGYQALHGIAPDLTMMGKIIGGGFPIGGVGGRKELMDLTNPATGHVLASGTFSGNPLSMVAGGLSVRHLTQAKIDQIDAWATRIEAGIVAKCASVGLPVWTRRVGSLVAWFFHDPGPGVVYGGTRPDLAMVKRHQLAMLVSGLFPTPRAALATSTAMSDALVDEIIERIGASFDALLADPATETALART